jgi:hypothetical protein
MVLEDRRQEKTAAIISGSNEVTSVVKAYNDVSNDAGKKIHVLIATQSTTKV